MAKRQVKPEKGSCMSLEQEYGELCGVVERPGSSAETYWSLVLVSSHWEAEGFGTFLGRPYSEQSCCALKN